MSSLPEHNTISVAAPVHAFQYQEPDSLEPTVGGPAQWTARSQARASTEGLGGSEDLERCKAEARAEGVREGLLQAQKTFELELAGERAKIEEAIRNFRSQAAQYYARAEVELVQLALAIAAKILHREAQVDPTLVAALVRITLEKLQHGTNVSVCVRPEEVAEWNKYFELHKDGQSRVQVKADPALQPRDCILETELGVTDVGLSSQLKEIEKGFFDLLAQRPDTK